MTIQQWPLADRPRERLLNYGSEKLSDSELLALLIQSGTKNQSSVDCARALLQRFGNLRAVIDADCKALCEQPGLGPAKFALVQAGAELGRRYFQQRHPSRGAITSCAQAKAFFKHTLSHKKKECFCVIYLDASHNIIQYEELFQGSLTSLKVHPRDFVKKCLDHDAVAVIIAHNHPRGRSTPSQADIQTTKHLIQMLHFVDVQLIDHIIVGENNTLSMQDEGYIDKYLIAEKNSGINRA